jgi:hypothetical protein
VNRLAVALLVLLPACTEVSGASPQALAEAHYEYAAAVSAYITIPTPDGNPTQAEVDHWMERGQSLVDDMVTAYNEWSRIADLGSTPEGYDRYVQLSGEWLDTQVAQASGSVECMEQSTDVLKARCMIRLLSAPDIEMGVTKRAEMMRLMRRFHPEVLGEE